MRDIRASLPPVPEDAQRRAVNRAYAEAQKKRKDAKTAKRKKKIVERDALEKHRRKQKLEGLPVEASPSTSVEGSSGDDGGEGGGVPSTTSLTSGRWFLGRRQVVRHPKEEEKMATRGR